MLIQLHETDKSCLSFGIKVKVVDYILLSKTICACRVLQFDDSGLD